MNTSPLRTALVSSIEVWLARPSARRSGLALAALCVGLAACGGLQLRTIKTAEHRPSNVAVYFKVETHAREPVAGLTADRFRIYEDEQLVSQYESRQTIINPEVAAAHYTLLLVDMSGSVTEGGAVDALVQAAGVFADRVEKEQKVAIYAFGGGADLSPIVPFTDQPGSAKAGISRLATFKPDDPSTNLNGAVVKALDELDVVLGHATQPLKFGTLVVFTDGTDRANRVTSAEMEQRVRDKPFDVFAIGLGAEIKPSELEAIGKSGTAMASDRNAVVKAFDDIGARVEEQTRSYYLLSYCSPSRAGVHKVRIETLWRDPRGGGEQRGSVESDFDATGFGPGCDPNSPPNFDVSRGEELTPPPPSPAPPPEIKIVKATKETRKPVKHSPPPAAPKPAPPPPVPPPASPSPASPPPASSDNPPDFNP